MVLYVNADRKPATLNDGRAAAANQLRGALIALDPKNEMGLQDLLTDVWRLPTETARESAFLGQSPQSPAEGAPAAAIVPPPVSADADVGALAAELTTAMLKLADVHKALAPFVGFATHCASLDDVQIAAIDKPPEAEDYATISHADFRALLRAAGLFTDDMRPSQPPAADASVKPAEVAATPPPADAEEPDHDGADAPSDGDPLRGQRMDSADVGEGDEL